MTTCSGWQRDEDRKDKGDETACTTFCLVLDGFS